MMKLDFGYLQTEKVIPKKIVTTDTDLTAFVTEDGKLYYSGAFRVYSPVPTSYTPKLVYTMYNNQQLNIIDVAFDSGASLMCVISKNDFKVSLQLILLIPL